jgi:hypothetical protein
MSTNPSSRIPARKLDLSRQDGLGGAGGRIVAAPFRNSGEHSLMQVIFPDVRPLVIVLIRLNRRYLIAHPFHRNLLGYLYHRPCSFAFFAVARVPYFNNLQSGGGGGYGKAQILLDETRRRRFLLEL